MKISVVMPNYNGERFLEESLQSVIRQREDGVDLEFIVVDGASKDSSLEIIEKYRDDIDVLVSEKDDGAPSAINKGLKLAKGDIVCWLNSDDTYYTGALKRVLEAMEANPKKALCFGHCPIVNEDGEEIRIGITRFKEMLFPISCLFVFQCINYVSQPASFYRREAFEKAGPLREDLLNAWDYDLELRIWRHGGGLWLENPPVSTYRWYEGSLSGRLYHNQFREDWEAGARSAGRFSLQSMIHLGVRWGIVGSYWVMSLIRGMRKKSAER